MTGAPKKPWKQPLIAAISVVIGSVAIFFPAWLPESPRIPTEEGIVEGLQFTLVLATAAVWFGIARSAGRTGPFYQIMGVLSVALALGEADSLIEKTTHFEVEYFYLPLGLWILLHLKKHRVHLTEFLGEFVSHPAAGFFASAFLLIFVLARFLGTSLLWEASLGSNYSQEIPQAVASYLELLAYYLFFVGAIGLGIRPHSHDPTEFD